jgi:hypothetical protein
MIVRQDLNVEPASTLRRQSHRRLRRVRQPDLRRRSRLLRHEVELGLRRRGEVDLQADLQLTVDGGMAQSLIW